MALVADTLLQERYLIVRQAGQGGMGAVYEAIDQRLGTTVALKQTLITDPQFDKAFTREARLLAALRHPALTRVIDFFSDSHGQFLVMEFIPGDDLSTRMHARGTPFPVADVVRWADQLLDALSYLHGRQPPVIHRDIKPQNLKLTSSGEIVLLDFGLAKGLSNSATQATTSASLFGYTLQFAPLEQIQGTGTDQRSDLYSLAATLHYLLTGVAPPNALTRATAVLSRQPDPLGPASAQNALVPSSLDAVLIQAMALDPGARFASASAMRAALKGGVVASTGRIDPQAPTEVMRLGPSSDRSTRAPTIGAPTMLDAPQPERPQSTPARNLVSSQAPRVGAPEPPLVHAPERRRRRGMPVWMIVAIVLLLAPLGICARGAFVDKIQEGPLVPAPSSQARQELATLLAVVMEETAIVVDTSVPPAGSPVPESPVPPPPASQDTPPVLSALSVGGEAWVDPDESPELLQNAESDEPLEERPRLYGGAQVTILGMQDELVHVRTPENLSGFLHASADELLVAEPPQESEASGFQPGYLVEVVLEGGIPLRHEPLSTSPPVIERLDAGSIGVVEELRGDWLRVRLADRASGWLRWYYDGKHYAALLPATRMEPSFERTLMLEDPPVQGEDVRRVQERLREWGHGEVGTIDGIFGPSTAEAVRAFQRVNRLEADGVVGERTWQALFRAGPRPRPPG